MWHLYLHQWLSVTKKAINFRASKVRSFPVSEGVGEVGNGECWVIVDGDGKKSYIIDQQTVYLLMFCKYDSTVTSRC
jgi:hypothetical protein